MHQIAEAIIHITKFQSLYHRLHLNLKARYTVLKLFELLQILESDAVLVKNIKAFSR